MNKAIFAILLTALTILTLTACIEKDRDYILYISLNDKNTGEHYITTEDALEKANALCKKHVDSYEQTNTFKNNADSSGKPIDEQTIIFILHDLDEEEITEIQDEFTKEFSRSKVYVKKNT